MTSIQQTNDLHSADLVQRLRTSGSVRSWEEADKQRAEAADRIEQLERENAKLHARLDKMSLRRFSCPICAGAMVEDDAMKETK